MSTTLADHIRALPNEALTALLRARPDLMVPIPADLGALAARAQARASVGRALDGLDEFTLRILDAVRLSRGDDGSAALATVTALAEEHADAVHAAVERLRECALLFGPDPEIRVAGGVDEMCSPYPAGLGRPAAELGGAVAVLCADAARLRRALLPAPAAARAVLDRLAAGPPIGTVAGPGPDGQPERRAGHRRGRPASEEADSPVRWLVEHHLLAPVGPPGAGAPMPRDDDRYEAVELPRELGLLLRRDVGPLGVLRPTPPELAPPEGRARPQAAIDSAGAGQAMEAVRQAEALLTAIAVAPVPLLRGGGIGVLPLRRLAKAAGVDEATAALLLEVTSTIGLLGETESTSERGAAAVPVLMPTPAYDVWRALPLARRWSELAEAWWTMQRQPGLVGSRDEKDKTVSVLSPEVARSGAPLLRRSVLDALASLPPAASPTAAELMDLLAWRTPRRISNREAAIGEVIADAARIGVTALNALTAYGLLLLAEDLDDDDPLGVAPGGEVPGGSTALARAIGPLLPTPVDHVLIQADLTVVVPGPAEPALAAELEIVAEHESGGGANVYRVTDASIRRALDTGYSGDDLHALFRRRSKTSVPQTLTYLVDDLARRHGGLRCGPAGSYLRSDDEALLAQVLADKRLAPMSMRRLAPTVLVSTYHSGRLVSALREAGYAPVAEDAGGGAVLRSPKVLRAPGPATPTRLSPPQAPTLTAPLLAGVVEQLRRGEAVARTARRAPAVIRAAQGHADVGPTKIQGHTEAMAVLQQAVRDKQEVWVGYVDPHGSTVSRLVLPVSMGAGYLRAEDERTETVHTFALHRITAAVLAD